MTTDVQTVLDMANRYLEKGISVIPLHEKIPIGPWKEFQTRFATGDELRDWFSDTDYNVGIVTGDQSGVAVIDIDSEEGLKLAKEKGLPEGPMVRTHRGYHFYFKHEPGIGNFQKRDDLPGIDLRGEGGYVVAPPSVHPHQMTPDLENCWTCQQGKDDFVYEWVGPKKAKLSKLPDWVIKPFDSTVKKSQPSEPLAGTHQKSKADLYAPRGVGDRNMTLARLTGMWARHLDLPHCLEAAYTWNDRNLPPLPDEEVRRTVESIYITELRNHPEREQRVLKYQNLTEFLSHQFQPREMILDPIITTQSVNMLASYRGVGKTHCSLGIAWAVASGGEFLRWKAPKPRSVLMIDGEMPGTALQARLSGIMAGSPCEEFAPDRLRIITPDSQEFAIPDLATPQGQEALEPALEGIELVILDNISALTNTRENDSDDWGSMQRWGLVLRHRGISSLWNHHTGHDKSRQRGTSRREDILDTSILLQHPSDHDPAEGARFEVSFTKARNLHGDDAKSFEVRLEEVGEPINGKSVSAYHFHCRDLDHARIDKVRALHELGMTPREIMEETGFSSSSVYRLIKKIKAVG